MAKAALSKAATTSESSSAPESAAAKAQRNRPVKATTHPDAFPPTPSVLPATSEPDGVVERVHIKALIASPLNPRKTFPEESIAELADSIVANGLQQPLVGREATEYLENIPSAREVYIGGRRLRALEKLYAEGRWPLDKLPGHLVPMVRRDVDDLTVLTVAIAENVNREDMHPLEEGQAFAELRRRGRTLDEIAGTYGKGKRWVEQRIQVATGLDEKTKELFQAGKINMESARVLVRLPETERKGVVTAIVKGDAGYENAAAIKARIAEGLPEVSKALFDVSLYRGECEMGGRHHLTKRFSDVAQFRTLQQAAIDAKREELRGKWAFVEALQVKDAGNFTASEHGFDRMWEAADPAQHGALIGIAPDLSVRIIEGVCRGKAPSRAPAPTTAALKAAGDPVAAVGAGRREYAHKAKSQVLQTAVFARGHRAALEMAIMAMLGDQSMVGIKTDAPSFDACAVAPELVARMEAWRKRLGVTAFKHIDPTVRTGTSYLEFEGGWSPNNTKRLGVFEQLGDISDDDLRELFDTLVAVRCISMAVYGTSVSLGDKPIAIAAAKRYGADMAKGWRIDADYLAKLQADDLHALAARLNLWLGAHQPKNHKTISLGDLQRMKVVDRRATILDFVVANDVRYVPPEMEIADEKAVEKALRATYKPKAPEPEQLDLVDAVKAAETRRGKLDRGLQRLLDDAKPSAARLTWVKAATLAHKQLVIDVAAALPHHPAFGEKEILLGVGTARLLLDQSTTEAGDYYVIGIEGRHGYETPDEVASLMSDWLSIMSRYIATAQPTSAPAAPATPETDRTVDITCAIDVPEPLLLPLRRALGAIGDAIGAGAKLLLKDGEYIYLQRKDEATLDIRAHHTRSGLTRMDSCIVSKELAAAVRAWLGTPSAERMMDIDPPALVAATPCQSPEAETEEEDDAAIDQLFDGDAETDEAEQEGREPIAFVRSPYCDLTQDLLDTLSDALPRHQAYGAASLRITAADATITLTCETVDEPDGGDPDSYILTGYLDDTLLRDKEPLPGARCAEVITAWLASLTSTAGAAGEAA